MSFTHEKINNLFKGVMLGSEEKSESYHCIVTDHPYMAQIGLSAFTTGELYEWMTKTNAFGQFVNLNLINEPSSPLGENEDVMDRVVSATYNLLHSSSGSQNDPGYMNYYFNAWRNEDRGGSYQLFKNFRWNYYGRYENEFDNQFNNFTNVEVDYSNSFPYYSVTPKTNIDYRGISQTINMNDVVRFMESRIIDDEWLDKDPNFVAIREYVTDIKSSKSSCITWQSLVDFNLSLGFPDPNNKCIKRELVTYKLYLYDTGLRRDPARRLTFNDLTIVSPVVDNTGRVGTNDDGRLTPPSLNPSPSNSVAGSLDIHYAGGGKWESGTTQILAQLVTNFDAGDPVPLSDNLSQSSDNLLSPSKQHRVASGLAMPITMKDDNPKRWSPDYKKSENCRATNEYDKFTVTAFNLSPRPYNSGEIVMLNKFRNQWVISQLYSEQPEVTPEIDPEAGKWSFMYLMANSEDYFRNTANNIVDSDAVELMLRYNYYKGDPNNEPDSYPASLDVNNNYFQVTSWDFMGPNIGGLRSNNLLSCTQFTINENYELFENNGKFNTNFTSAPFFGCVFPNGYSDGGKYESYKAGNQDFELITTNTSIDDLFFIKPTGNVFVNNNGRKNAPGMFVKNDPSLKHLPADIALNASPDANNGSPLQDIKMFDWFKSTSSNDNLQDLLLQNVFSHNASGYQKRYHWIRNNTINDSMFDLKPITKNRISFRPLSAELYTSFDNKKNSVSSIGEFGAKLVDQIMENPGSRDIISNLALNRNYKHAPNMFYVWEDGLFRALKYNFSLTKNAPSTDSNFPRPGWENKANLNRSYLLEPAAPAGAVGIIGAQYTVEAVDKIAFVTSNYIGQGSWFRNNRWYPSWGAYGGGDYKSFNTTALYAKVYEAWPREQTVYDPRFFAVYHFNPDVHLGYKTQDVKKQWYQGSTQLPEPPTNPPITEQYPDGLYSIDIEESSVDIRIPTYLSGSTILSGLAIYRDDPDMPIREKDAWRIEPKRRGKLLPYTYTYVDIGVDSSAVHFIDPGAGYTEKDTFKVTGGSGSGVKVKPIFDGAGEIFKFEVIESGGGFMPGNFLRRTHGDIEYGDLAVKIVEDSIVSSGTGLQAGFKFGRSYDRIMTDLGPKIPTSDNLLRLTPQAVTAPQDAIAGSNGIMDDNKYETEFTILSPSPTNKYDLFFHFHNDISHTFVFSDWLDGTSLAIEQDVTLQINLN